MAVNIKMVTRHLYKVVDANNHKHELNKFFTEQAAKDWVRSHGHTLNRVDCGYRTWRKI